jgi:hypothetical protein
MAEKTEKMISRVVTQNVTVIRDGKRHSPPRGKAFPFTEQEVAYLDKVAPGSVRLPVNERTAAESADVAPSGGDTGEDATAPDQKAKPTAKRTPRRGANKAETDAAAADAEAEDGDAGDDAGDAGDDAGDEDDDI